MVLRYADEVQRAYEKTVDLGEVTLDFNQIDAEQQLVPQGDYDYFFRLQVEIEKTGHMDYYKYSAELWRCYFQEVPREDDLVYQEFVSNIILGLKQINMRELVYSHVLGRLDKLVQAAVERSAKVVLYSAGDVEATGYQVAKIQKSRIVKEFLARLKSSLPDKRDRKAYVKDNTGLMIEDNKKEAFQRYLSQATSLPRRIVVVEDSQKNIDAIRAIGEEHGVEVVSFWTLYSRSGIKAKKAAEKGEGEKLAHADVVQKYGGIETFDELLGHADVFENALVLVDFDGVIGDHVRMRNAQAQVIWNAVCRAGGGKDWRR